MAGEGKYCRQWLAKETKCRHPACHSRAAHPRKPQGTPRVGKETHALPEGSR